MGFPSKTNLKTHFFWVRTSVNTAFLSVRQRHGHRAAPVGYGRHSYQIRHKTTRAGRFRSCAGPVRSVPVPVGADAGAGTGIPRCQPVPLTDRKKRCI